MNPQLMYTAIVAFGGAVVSEVLDLVACSSPEIMHENFVKLRMNSFRDCVEMLFNFSDEELNYTPTV